MKILLIILSIISLTTFGSCTNYKINESIYIGSIGIDYIDNKFEVYYYLPSSLDVGSTTNTSDTAGYVGMVESNSIEEAFSKMNLENNVYINYRHISSLILSYNLLSNVNLSTLFEYIKNSYILDINFYIFSTNENIENIYSLENPNNESVITSMLLDPTNKIYEYLYATPVHFLNFCNFYLSNRIIKLPLISINQIWNINDELKNSYYISGVVLTSANKTIISNDTSFIYLNCNDKFLISDTNTLIYDYNIDYLFNDSININISFRYTLLENISKNELINYISNKILNIVNTYLVKIDFLNINYFNNLDNFKTNISNININIETKEK